METALSENPPTLARDGGFVAPGWDEALDEARGLRDDSRQIIAALQARYADETGITALKIKFNNVLGYFVDVPARYGDPLMKPPLSETFIHRQTLASAMRYTTTELADLARDISEAAEKALAVELSLFDDLLGEVAARADAIAAAANGLAALDVAAAMAAHPDAAELQASLLRLFIPSRLSRLSRLLRRSKLP